MAPPRRLSALATHLIRRRAGGRVSASPVADDDEEEEEDSDEPTLVAALEEAGELEGELRLVGWDEIMRHDTREDLWVAIDGVVYDMTAFVGSDHPGGEPAVSPRHLHFTPLASSLDR